MKKPVLLIMALIASFCFGFAFKTAISNQTASQTKKVTGIGGIFFKSENPAKLKDWYQKNLGLNINQYGAVFEWHQGADSTKKGFTQWAAFGKNTDYFEPSSKDFMINYRVEDLEKLIAELKQNEVKILDSLQVVSYGKFIHILDIEGNKIELWQPNDVEYEKLGQQMGFKTTK